MAPARQMCGRAQRAFVAIGSAIGKSSGTGVSACRGGQRIQGQVKLHAIIARDGWIQSLNAISGHPLLVHAALEAVGQWRYRPYYLNGEAVEVETFITVNFRKEMH